MADNPFAQFGLLQPGRDLRSEALTMRMMRGAETLGQLPRSRFAGRAGGMGGGNPMLSGLMGAENQPDYSQFTYDPQAHAAASQYLQQFGLSPLAPEQVQRNAVLPNSGFFGAHPKLSGMIEGGLFGAAATRGSDTWGEGISNVAEGLIGGPRMRQGILNQQFAKPFQAASMMEGMQDRTQKRELQEAEIQHLRAENQKLGRPDHDFRAFGVSRNDPEIATIDNTTGQVTYTTNPHYDPTLPRSGTTPEDQFYDQKRVEFKTAGTPVTSKDILDWQGEWKKKSAAPEHPPWMVVPGKNGGPPILTQGYQGMPMPSGAQAPRDAMQGPGRQAKARQDYIQKMLGSKPSAILGLGYKGDLLDGPAKEKFIGDFYDQQIAPNIQQSSPLPAQGGDGSSPDRPLIYNPATGRLEPN